MGASADIYSLIRPPAQQPGPLDNYSAMMQLRAMGDNSELSALHRQKLVGDMQEEAAFKSKLADWVKAGATGTLPAEAYSVSPSRAAAFDKTRLEGEKTRGEIDKNKVEVHGAQVKQLRDQLASVTDDAGLQALRENTLKLYGPQAAQHIPASVNDPNFPKWRQDSLMTGDKLLEQMTPKFEKVDQGGKIVMVDINPFTNPAVKGMTFDKTVTPDALLSAVTTRRGQDMQNNQPVWDEARGVFVMRPGGGAAPGGGGVPVRAPAAPVPAAPGAPAAAVPAAPVPAAATPPVPAVIRPEGLPPKPTDVHNLRNEFNALPEVKGYRDIVPVVESARNAPDTRAGDIQLGYAVGKILDPNSVVREGEIKMVGDAAPVYEKYKGEFNSVYNGTGRFTPETRKQLVAMLDNAVNQRETAYKAAEATYGGIASKAGIPVEQVIIKPMARTNAAAEPGAPAAPKMFDSMPDPSKYKGRRLQADDGTVYQSDGSRWVRAR